MSDTGTQQQQQQQQEQQQESSDPALHLYTYNENELNALCASKPWMSSSTASTNTTSAKHFCKVSVSPSALFKILSHCQSGVDKGRNSETKSGNPIEVMGLLLGRPDVTVSGRLVVTDAFPLPIEGFETRVVADDDHVHNHMIELSTSLEHTRKEKVMGWYHSHPFDVGAQSHCFLSSTDISTQLLWQRSEDPQGNPFVAIVVDPLRSIHKGRPELKAFRCYPPEYASPVANECPDGSIVADEQSRIAIWGAAWNRYYELEVEYFMSQSAKKVMSTLTQSFLWMRNLGHTPSLEKERQAEFPVKICNCAEKLRKLKLEISNSQNTNTSGGSSSVREAQQSSSSQSTSTRPESLKEDGLFCQVCHNVEELATEKLHGDISQAIKSRLFC